MLEGIVLQQSNLVDSTVTLHLHLLLETRDGIHCKCRFLKNCESIVSQGVVSLMLHDACMYREPVTR